MRLRCGHNLITRDAWRTGVALVSLIAFVAFRARLPGAPGRQRGPLSWPLMSAAVTDLFLMSRPVIDPFLMLAPVINAEVAATAEPASATNSASIATINAGD